MNFEYNTLVLTNDALVPAVNQAIQQNKWVESLHTIGDTYIVTFGKAV